MLKWLFWLTILLVFWGISRSRSRGISHKPNAAPGNVNMIACAYCRLHVPENEAVVKDGQSFCCEQHRRQWTQTAR